jgi:hypothetical protein
MENCGTSSLNKGEPSGGCLQVGDYFLWIIQQDIIPLLHNASKSRGYYLLEGAMYHTKIALYY